MPVIPRALVVGELWLAGRFRCSSCRHPASRLELIEQRPVQTTLERWSLGEPSVAERLRRHWRHDPYERRNWPAWFRRGWPSISLRQASRARPLNGLI